VGCSLARDLACSHAPAPALLITSATSVFGGPVSLSRSLSQHSLPVDVIFFQQQSLSVCVHDGYPHVCRIQNSNQAMAASSIGVFRSRVPGTGCALNMAGDVKVSLESQLCSSFNTRKSHRSLNLRTS
jgi:hypothetical protein